MKVINLKIINLLLFYFIKIIINLRMIYLLFYHLTRMLILKNPDWKRSIYIVIKPTNERG